MEEEAASEGVTEEFLGVEAAFSDIMVCTCQNPRELYTVESDFVHIKIQ